jgi:hypothetical protein
MPTDKPSRVREVREAQGESSSSSDRALRNLTGDPSPVAHNDFIMQLVRKTAQEVLKPKTTEMNAEQKPTQVEQEEKNLFQSLLKEGPVYENKIRNPSEDIPGFSEFRDVVRDFPPRANQITGNTDRASALYPDSLHPNSQRKLDSSNIALFRTIFEKIEPQILHYFSSYSETRQIQADSMRNGQLNLEFNIQVPKTHKDVIDGNLFIQNGINNEIEGLARKEIGKILGSNDFTGNISFKVNLEKQRDNLGEE